MFRSQPMFLAAAVIVLAAVPAQARAPRVHDRANLFKTEAVQQANQVMAAVADDYGIDVLIETAGARQSGEGLSGRLRETWNRFFPRSEVRNPRRSTGARAIYVRISTDPNGPRVEVEVGDDPALRKGFPPEARAQLEERLLAAARSHHYDEGLREAVEFVQKTLTANLGVPFEWAVPAGIVVSLLAAWLALECLRFLCVRRDSVPALSGGTVVPGLFAMMVCRDYRRLFGPGGSSVHGPTDYGPCPDHDMDSPAGHEPADAEHHVPAHLEGPAAS